MNFFFTHTKEFLLYAYESTRRSTTGAGSATRSDSVSRSGRAAVVVATTTAVGHANCNDCRNSHGHANRRAAGQRAGSTGSGRVRSNNRCRLRIGGLLRRLLLLGKTLAREAQCKHCRICRRSGSGSESQLIVTSEFSGSCGLGPCSPVLSVASLAARAFSRHPSTTSFLNASGFRFRSSCELRFRFPCGLLLRCSDGSCPLSPTGIQSGKCGGDD